MEGDYWPATLMCSIIVLFIIYLSESYTESRKEEYVWRYKHGVPALWFGALALVCLLILIFGDVLPEPITET